MARPRKLPSETPWYHWNAKPAQGFAHCGPYKRRHTAYGTGQPFEAYSWWNGEFWGKDSMTPQGAMHLKHLRSAFQYLPWKGLTRRA